ncbi:hypothetical protein K402DRAFT_247735 [Aulographum hederae CBS 113979]|uniref:Uncharacterized protein n=1 Tax=Aulographum hederae CBS 113979 TaxID=1176131 RepID=A0A6G1HAP2_9PEZI|nr:hypothetical protein K402DRAFT_247735 [Aulographum hederae CBS 113979]
MTYRTNTSQTNIFTQTHPKAATFDFTGAHKSASEASPRHIRISLPYGSTWGSSSHWHSSSHLTVDFSGPARVRRAWGPRNSSELVGTGDFQVSFEPFCVYSWERDETADSGKFHKEVLEIVIRLDETDEEGGEELELLFRTVCSILLDAGRYPRFATTPWRVKTLVGLFPGSAAWEDFVTRALLKAQLAVTYREFAYYPVMEAVKPTKLWSWSPLPQKPPDWVARLQWEGMQKLSRWKVAVAAIVARKAFGMHALYEEYIPERLEHCTRPSFDEDAARRQRVWTGSREWSEGVENRSEGGSGNVWRRFPTGRRRNR